MANKEIVPYSFDPGKKPNVLALTIVPPEVTPIRSSQSYFAQAIRRHHVHFLKAIHANKSLV